MAITAILALHVLLGAQVIRWVLPGGPVGGGQLSSYTIRKLRAEIGYHRNDLSVMLAGAFWAFVALQTLARSLVHRAAIGLGAGVAALALVLTGGRGGYVAWCVVGAVFGIVRWHRYLLVAPVLVLVVVTALPSVAERALHGTQARSTFGPDAIDLDDLTAGRNLIWPPVIAKISEAPLLGYGRAAIQRVGVTASLMAQNGEGLLEHPHNAYLEMLLDAGVTGLAVFLGLYGTIAALGLALVRDRRHPERVAVGGVGLALVLAQLVGALTGQSFWPRETTIGMWCAGGLVLRLWVERTQASWTLARPRRAGAGDAGRRLGGGPGAGADWWRRTRNTVGGERRGPAVPEHSA